MGFELTTLVVIGIYCTGSCKSNYHTIMTMTAPRWHWKCTRRAITIMKKNILLGIKCGMHYTLKNKIWPATFYLFIYLWPTYWFQNQQNSSPSNRATCITRWSSFPEKNKFYLFHRVITWPKLMKMNINWWHMYGTRELEIKLVDWRKMHGSTWQLAAEP